MEVFSVFATLSLVDLISGPLDRMRSAMRGAEGGVNSFGASMGKLTMGMAPLAGVAAAIIGGLGLFAASTLATEKALGELATLGVRNLAAVEAAALQASNTMAGITKPAFITAAYDIKSGIASLSDEGVAAFTTLAAKTAQATKATVADMTNLGATAYGIHKRMYAGLTDEAFGGMLYAGVASSVQAFKTTGAAMNQAMSNLGAAATQANRPLEEQLAVLGTLQNSMDASVAGTAYKSFFRDATRGFKALGINAVDATGQMKSMPDLLAALEQKFGSLEQTDLDAITKAFGAETGAMIQNLLGKSDDLRRSIEGVGTAMNGGTGFINDMAASVNAGLGPSLALLRQRASGAVEELGKHLAPAFSALAATIGMVMIRLQEWAKTPFAAYVLKLAGGVSTAILAVTGLSAALWLASAALPMLTRFIAPLKAALLGLSWPVIAVIAVVAALYAAYKSNFGGIANLINRWADTISVVVRGVIAIFQNLTGSTFEIKGALAEEIKAKGLENLVIGVGRIVYRIREFFTSMMDAVGAAMTEIDVILVPVRIAVADLLNWFTGLFGEMDAGIGGAVATWSSFGQAVGAVVGGALTAAAKSLVWLTDKLRSVGKALSAYYSGVWGALVDGFSGLGNAFGRVWSRLQGVFDAFLALGRTLASAFSQLWQAAAPLFGSQVSGGTDMWAAFGNVVGNIVCAAVYLLATAFQVVLAPIEYLINAVRLVVSLFSGDMVGATEALRGMVVSLGNGFAALGDLFGVGDAIRSAWAGIMAYFDSINLFESGAKILMTLADGVKSAMMYPFNAVSEAFSMVRNLLPFSDAKEGPLATLTTSGGAIMTTLSEGVLSKAGALYESVTGALGSVGDTLSGWWAKAFGDGAVPQLPKPLIPEIKTPQPTINAPETLAATGISAEATSRTSQRRAGEGNTTITIHIGSIALPNVANGQDFVNDLQGLVAGYGGSAA